MVQEHWLLPNELSCLNDVHCDFISVGRSAVDISNNLNAIRSEAFSKCSWRRSGLMWSNLEDKKKMRVKSLMKRLAVFTQRSIQAGIIAAEYTTFAIAVSRSVKIVEIYQGDL